MQEYTSLPQLTNVNDISKAFTLFRNEGIEEEDMALYLTKFFTIDLDLLEEVRLSNQ